ncbi:MAG: AZOBR_p60025 family cell surface glycopolymer formation protein [Acidimicrobiales bacterium]
MSNSRASLRSYGRRLVDDASPLVVAGAVTAIEIVFVLARIVVAGKGRVTALIVAGSQYVNPHGVPIHLPILPGSGYDGQFYFRMALNPFDFAHSAYGVTLDTPFRLQRVGYPALVWLLSLGHASLVPFVMILVNVLALGMIAFVLAQVAVESGQSVWFGALGALFAGYALSLGRDLTEPMAAALLLLGIYSLSKGRPWWAALLLSGSVLTRETAMVIVGSVGLAWIVSMVRPAVVHGVESRRWRLLVAGGVPSVVFLSYQVFLHAQLHHTVLKSDFSANLGLPIVALVRGIVQRAGAFNLANALWSLQFIALLLLVVVVARSLRRIEAPLFLKLSFVFLLVLFLSLSSEIWANDADLRSLDQLWILAWYLLLLGRKRGLARWSPMVVVWGLTALQLIVFI